MRRVGQVAHEWFERRLENKLENGRTDGATADGSGSSQSGGHAQAPPLRRRAVLARLTLAIDLELGEGAGDDGALAKALAQVASVFVAAGDAPHPQQ